MLRAKTKDNIYTTLSILTALYLFVNFAAILWQLVSPDGFWSGIWYLILLSSISYLFFEFWGIIDNAVMTWKTSRDYSFTFNLLFLTVLAGILYLGPILYGSWSVMNRYDLINQSEKYLSKGEAEYAISVAEEALTKQVENGEVIKPYIFLAYLYKESETAKKKKANLLFQATINLAYCLQTQWKDINKAELLYKKGIHIAEVAFPESPEYKLFPTVGCFKIFMAKGQNQKADSCYSEISKLLSKLNWEDVFYKAQSLYLYSLFADKSGDWEKAINIRKEALEILESSENFQRDNFYIQMVLNSISDFVITGDTANLTKYLSICKSATENKKDKVIYRDYLIARSKFYELSNNFKEAENGLKEAITLIEKHSGRESFDYIKANYSLASLYLRTGANLYAAKKFDECINLLDKISENRTIKIDIFLGAAIAGFKNGEVEYTSIKVTEIEKKLYREFEEVFLFLPEEEKEAYVASLENKLNILNSIHTNISDSSNICQLYDNNLTIKAIALEVNKYLRDFISQESTNDFKKDHFKIMQRKEYLNKLEFSAFSSNFYLKLADSIRSAEVSLIKKVASSSGFNMLKLNAITWQDVKENLRNGECSIEFINIPDDPSNERINTYYALVVTDKSTSPSLIKLFSETELKSVISGDQTEVHISKLYRTENITKLHSLLLKPLKKYLSNSRKVYFSLSGMLNNISFPVLTLDENYDVEILSSMRVLVKRRSGLKNNLNKETLLYGNINYGNSDNFDSSNSKNASIAQKISRSSFELLPGTKKEIDQISAILKVNGYNVKQFEQNAASEKSLRILNKTKFEIIHFATHGYYFPLPERYRVLEFINLNSDRVDLIRNPLFRSGLLFAGANNAKFSKVADNDGILSSYEISKLDLSGVNMVVLSACESGLGDIYGSEGVYGLQRAFKLAGVESLLVSLWKIPDEETSKVMKLFYKYYTNPNYSKEQALKKAQLEYRKENSNPYFWGAFQIIQ